MEKIALFGFIGDPIRFFHVLLKALDFSEKYFEIKVVVEGSATKLIAELARDDHPLHNLYEKVKEKVLLMGVCRACAQKMGTLKAAEEQHLRLLEDMSGHPSMANFTEQGYKIITF